MDLTCAVHVVSGQLEQPHVLVGDGIKGATGQQDEWNTAGGHLGLPPIHHCQKTVVVSRRKSY